MNYRLLSKVFGLLLLLLSFAMLLCLGYAYFDHERRPGLDAVESFGISCAASTCVGAGLLIFGRGAGRHVLRKEAVAIVGLGWIICGIFGALPYVFCEPNLGPIQALFESISGFTTTGASVMTNIEVFPQSILLWRALTQWLGGLGILVLFVALLTHLGVGSKALFHNESSAKSGEGLQSRIHDIAVRLWLIYLLLSIICCGGLMALGMDLFDALTHTFTAISTGGFSTRNASIAAFDSLGIELWLVLFMILGSISFMLIAWLLRGRWDRWTKEEECKAFLLIVATITLLIALDLSVLEFYPSALEAIRHSLFTVTSIITTTGFATVDFDRWPPASRVLLLLVMFIGGCAGSTAGGIKVGRFLLFLKIVRVAIVASFRPNQVIGIHLNGNYADDQLKIQTLFFVALAGVLVGSCTSLICLLEPGLDIVSGASAVIASLFNVGPGLGAVGPSHNFAHFSHASLLLLALLMVLGRLEFFAILVLFFPSLWRKY